MKTQSNLEQVLEAGEFAVTAEISSPANIDLETIRQRVSLIKGCVDAFNVPDGQAAVVAMASWAGCLVGLQDKLDPIVHMTCRDRNRIALQMDVLAVAAFGVNNILCLSGDPIPAGNHPRAKPVFDLDAVQLIAMVRQLRDARRFENGELIAGAEPRLYIGAATNPFARPAESTVDRLEAKVMAGADFVQTQPVYDIEAFSVWVDLIRKRGLHNRVKILAGIAPVMSLAAARYMQTKLPDMSIPDAIIDRLAKVRRREEAAEEGMTIAVETIGQLRQMDEVAGVHVMTLQREDVVAKICRAAGLCPRP